MDMGTAPRRQRRLRKASDLCTVNAAASSSSKRVRMSKEHSNCEDRFNSLPDDILIMILGKLDARTMITTTILSKRWRELPRRWPTQYDFSVDEFLPSRYHRLKQITMEAKAGYEADKNAWNLPDIYAFKDQYERFYAIRDGCEQWRGMIRMLTTILQRYERHAMRCYVKRMNQFLLPPENLQQHRSIQKLRLQTIGRSSYIDQWITAAIARWGVEDLEIVIDNSWRCYDFQLLDGCQNVRLKRLLLSNCYHAAAPNSLTFQRLTTLILCKCSSRRTYDILINCVQLMDFRFKNCYPSDALHINVPTSKLKNLQFDDCKIGKIYLASLPCLENFACKGQPTKLYYGEVPRLRHVSLDFLQTGDNGEDDSSDGNRTYPLRKFFNGMPPLEYLVLQLRGNQMWIEPAVMPIPFSHLRKLFIADMPMNWDIFWILILLDAAPTLELLHVHIDNSSDKMSAGLDVQLEHRQYSHLKELVVVGFDGAGWQTGFVKHIMRASPRMRRTHLLDGHVVEDEERELGDLKIVPHRREWHECERSEVLDDLTDGINLQNLEIILE